jgi:hypothetical protein
MSEKSVIKSQDTETPAAETEQPDELATIKKTLKKFGEALDGLAERVDLLEKRQPGSGAR